MAQIRLLSPFLVVAILLIGMFAAWEMVGNTDEIPSIAVAAADQSLATTVLARDLTVMLGSLQSVKGGSMRLIANDRRVATNADLIFETSASTRQPEANLVLLYGRDRTILWSKDFKPSSGNPSDLKQQLAYTAARVLDCALDTFGPGGKRLEPQTRALYLNGCAQFAELIGTNTTVVRGLLRSFVTVTFSSA